MERVPTQKSSDLIRYHRLMAGDTEEEIAQKDDVTPDEVRRSVQAGEQLEFARLLQQILGLRYQTAIDNERLRQRICKRLESKVIEDIRRLLKGERTLIERNRKTGEVRFHKVVDPKLILLGLEHLLTSTKMLPSDKLFHGITPDQVSIAFSRVCRKLKIADFRLHDLRHIRLQVGCECKVLISIQSHCCLDIRISEWRPATSI